MKGKLLMRAVHRSILEDRLYIAARIEGRRVQEKNQGNTIGAMEENAEKKTAHDKSILQPVRQDALHGKFGTGI